MIRALIPYFLAISFVVIAEHNTRAYSKIYMSVRADFNSLTTGTIKESYLTSNGGPATSYHVYYAYLVNGHSYENNVVSLSGHDAEDRKIVAKYRPGMAVMVYYDESNPGLSVLEIGKITPWTIGQAIAGLIFAGVAFFVKW